LYVHYIVLHYIVVSLQIVLFAVVAVVSAGYGASISSFYL